MKRTNSCIGGIGAPLLAVLWACTPTPGTTETEAATEEASTSTSTSTDTGDAPTSTGSPTAASTGETSVDPPDTGSDPTTTEPDPTTSGAVCGDGVQDGNEACDDGNKSNATLAKHPESTAPSLPGPIRCLAGVSRSPPEPDRARSGGGNDPRRGVLAT